MSLQHAVLGFLKYRSYTGYDLKRLFEASVRHFWSAQQSQIYQTLSDLESRGWATMELVRQDDRPNRKEYSITEEGRKELVSWLGQPRAEPPIRSPFLVQLFFSGELNDDEVLAVLEEKAEEIRGVLNLFETGTVSQPPQVKALPKREQFFWYLTLDYGIESARSSLAWIEQSMEKIRTKAYNEGVEGAFTRKDKS